MAEILLIPIIFCGQQCFFFCGRGDRLWNQQFCNFWTSVTITLDRVIRHSVVYQSSTSIYTPNFIQIGEKKFMDNRTYVRTGGRTLRVALLDVFILVCCLYWCNSVWCWCIDIGSYDNTMCSPVGPSVGHGRDQPKLTARQQTIAELFQTEKNYVGILYTILKVFYLLTTGCVTQLAWKTVVWSLLFFMFYWW